MSRADEEAIRQDYEQRIRHTNQPIPKLCHQYAVDIHGRVYRQRPGGWFLTGEAPKAAAAAALQGVRAVYQEKAANGQPLYEDPALAAPICHVERLPIPTLPESSGFGAAEFFGLLTVLAVIGVVLWLVVAHFLRGPSYPPSRTFATSYDRAGAADVAALTFSPNGKDLVAVDSHSGANLWNVGDGSLIKVLNNGSAPAAAAFSPNGRLLAIGDYYGRVYLWNVKHNHRRQIAEFTDPVSNATPGVYGLAFSPDGKILAVGEFSGKVYLWDVSSGKTLARLRVPSNENGGEVGSLTFSPNGQILAVGDSDGTTYLWNVTQRSRIAILNYPHASTTGITGVAFAPNGQILATLETSGPTILWNVSAAKVIGTLPVGDSKFLDYCSIAFSPTGRTLAAGCDGASTYLWDVASRQQKERLAVPSGNIEGVAFSPDGKTLAAGSDTGIVYLWNVGKLAR